MKNRITFILVAVAVGVALLPFGVMIRRAAHFNRLRTRLLCETDHCALRDAGRELLQQLTREDKMLNVIHIVRGSGRSPEASQFPKAILYLEPDCIRVDSEGYLQVELGGTMWHFGVAICSADFDEASGGRLGDHKLVDGMWYYDDEYTDPSYDKVIKALLKKNRLIKDRDKPSPS
jgi:hypothetical protein